MAQKFIVLTQARCGSELLVSLIGSHPDATCYAELFSSVTGHPERFNSFLDQVPGSYDATDESVRAALAGVYLKAVMNDPQAAAVGFKLLLEQLPDHPYVLPHLTAGERGESLKIIRLVRENELKVHLSRTAAAFRKQWHSTSTVEKRPAPLPVGEELLKALRGIRQNNEIIENTLPDLPSIRVAYEEFQHDTRPTVEAIQQFLGLPVHSVESPLKKLTSDDLSEAIANYDAVRETLEGTEFEKCLYRRGETAGRNLGGSSVAPISFVHIPKAGGSTLENIFKRNYADDEVFMAYGPHDGPIGAYHALPTDRKRQYKVVTGHYTMGESLQAMPYGSRHITILRHPVDRLLSSYYMYYHHANHPEGIRIRENNISLEQFADPAFGFGVDNLQTKYIAGLPPHAPCTPVDLKRAFDRLERHMTVGILERYKESIFLFARLFGWEDINYRHIGFNSKRPKRKEIDAAERRSILRHNLMDMELYSHGLALFEQRLAEEVGDDPALAAYLETEHEVSHARHYHPWRNMDGTLKERSAR